MPRNFPLAYRKRKTNTALTVKHKMSEYWFKKSNMDKG